MYLRNESFLYFQLHTMYCSRFLLLHSLLLPLLLLLLVKDAHIQSGYHYFFLACWILSALIGSCYTYAWDIKMDWGLFEHGYITRRERIYPYKVGGRGNVGVAIMLPWQRSGCIYWR